MTFKIIKGAAELNKAIASIQNRGAKLDQSIHEAAVSVLVHAKAHGDTTLADKLVHAMPKGGRKLALVEFLLAFGPVSKLDTVADKERIQAGGVFKLDKEKELRQAEAEAMPWTEFRKEPSVQEAFDAQAAVASVLKRLRAAGEKKLSVEHLAEARAEAKALLAALEAM